MESQEMSALPEKTPVAIPATDPEGQGGQAPPRPTPPPVKQPARPDPRRGVPPVAAPLLLVLAAAAVSALAWQTDGTALGTGLQQLRFDEATWLPGMAYHTFVTHAFVHANAADLGYAALGVVVFGWIVQKNVGWWRTLLLFGFCAACSVGLWQAAKTEVGQDLLGRAAGNVIDQVADKVGWDAAFTTWAGYDRAMTDLVGMRGAVGGAGGAVAGLMAFALCRRRLDGRVAVKWWALLLAAAYVGLGWAVVWPTFVGREMPYALLIGGALGGLFFVIPDKILAHVAGALKDSALGKASRGRGAAATA
jgi:membrane associated rhomboid family serine protease